MATLDAHEAFWHKAERHVFASPRRRKIEDISIENPRHLKANEVRWIDLPIATRAFRMRSAAKRAFTQCHKRMQR